MIWIAKLLYAALKWFTLVALITGIIMETWLSRKRIYFMFDCSILSQGLLYYTLHWLMEKHTVLHYDVHLRAELCVASAQSGIRPRPACILYVSERGRIDSPWQNWTGASGRLNMCRSSLKCFSSHGCLQYFSAFVSPYPWMQRMSCRVLQ